MLVLAGTLVYTALQNDVFTELIPPINDTGFTHDNVVAIGVESGDYVIGGKLSDRWITSTMDRRRWDQLDVFATVARLLTPNIEAQGRIGPTFGGNFGGRYLQNGWHSISGTGPTIVEGLANQYPGDRTAGIAAGARVHASVVTSQARVKSHLYANVDGQGAVGAGVSSVEGAIGGWLGAHLFGRARTLGAHVEAAVTRYHVADPNLALPGGYGVGWQFEWRAGIDITWSNRYRLAYEYRANEGGSGEPIGVVAFSLY